MEIASEAGISSQGVYRYFHNKHELFLAAVEEDFNRFAFEVLGSIAELPAPYLTGVFWRRVVEVMPNHVLAVNSVVSRNPDVLDRINSSKGAEIITEGLRDEVLKAFDNKILRQDLEPISHAASSCYMMMNVSIPLAFAGKYNTDDWFAMQGTQLAAAFYPVPNFQDPVVARNFEEQMMILGKNQTLINYKFD